VVFNFKLSQIFVEGVYYKCMKKIIFSLLMSFGILAFACAQTPSVTVTNTSQATSPVILLYPTKSCPKINSYLFIGKRGEEVRELQNFLFNYYGAPYTATGYFGPATKKYVHMFQKDNGVISTGFVGKLTTDKIVTRCGGGGDVACTREYKPVCGQLNSVQKTYSNRCEMNRAGASLVKDVACEQVVSNEPPASCKVWYDGCNTCSRSYVGGPMACTLMACIQGGTESQIWANRPQCREYFGGVSTAPVISSFSGPVQLGVGEKGTWRVAANVYNNSQLTYSISWGDEVNMAEKLTLAPNFINSVYNQSTSFEHSYAQLGTYTVTLVVRSVTGEEVRTTSTVKVTSSAIKCLDAGISYEEGKQLSCITNNYGVSVCIADAVYVCRKGVWATENTR
jgi:hypothetical protein